MSRDLIDMDLLEKLQMQFGDANNMYLACLDRDRNVLSACYRTGAEQRFFEEHISGQQMSHLLNLVEDSHVESILEEPLDVPYLKLCAIVNRAEGEPALIWVAVAVIEELLTEDDIIPEYVLRMSENQFYRAIGFLESLTKQLFAAKEQQLQAMELMDRAVGTERSLNEQLQRNDAMTEIVHMLESEEDVTVIGERMLRTVCDVLGLQGGSILYIPADGKGIQVAAEYSTEANYEFGERVKGKTKIKLPFFTGKPYMLSSKSMMPAEMEKFLTRYHLKAAIFQPVEMKDRSEMYLCFYQFDKRHTWSMEEITFVNDAKKVLQILIERRQANQQLVASRETYRAVLEHVGCGVYVVDYTKKEVIYANEQFYKVLSANTEDMDLQSYFFSTKQPEKAFAAKEVYLEQKNIWLNVQQTELDWIDGRNVSLGTIYDITEKKLYQQKIEHQISVDHLTGLYNRIRCEQDLERYIKEAELTGKEGAYLCIDLDDFQNVNAALGHHQADQLLKTIAHNLSRIPGIEKNCYRINGDEFAVIVHGKEYKALSRICKDLRTIFNRPWFVKDEDYYCTMSMGVVCFPTDGNNMDDLSRKVNLALSAAKKKGKNCVEFYNEKAEETSIHRLDLERNMRRATLNSCNEFEVYYQPLMRRQKEEMVCCGAEALVRWKSSELGMIPPKDFIPLAEYLGVINPIGEHVLSEAVNRCKYWNDCGYPDYRIGVNISVIQLLQPDFVSKLKQLLERTGIRPKNLILEVTEKLAVQDLERMKDVLTRTKKLGVKIALDDFGAGYSSVNHIRELPIDILKIDKSVIQKLGEDAFAEVLVKMAAELAETMDIMVCAEGVEENRQIQALQNMSIELQQGYYYGMPMPVKEFEKLF